MTLAIASPSASAYSETFIRMQWERLPCELRIHGGPVATETVPGGVFSPLSNIRGICDTIYEVGFRGTRGDGPQRRELARRLRSSKVHVLLANFGPTAVALAPVCAANGIALVAHFHGYDAHRCETVKEYGPAYQKLGESAQMVIAVSARMARALSSYGIPEEKIALIRYGCDPSLFHEQMESPISPVFFGVGRFVEKKAPYLTVLAFERVRKVCPAARLILGGDGPLFEATRNLVSALGLESCVALPGVLGRKAIADQLRNATAFVQHSITPASGPHKGDSEGTPVSVLEAMLSGVPIVATAHAGIAEVVEHGVTGYLVAERDVEAMAAGMLLFALDPAKARKFGSAARRVALANYTAEKYIAELRKALRI